MKINNGWKLVIMIAVSELAGVVGSMFSVQAIPTWYAGLVKPALNPPSFVFGPVWTTLYLLMGIAAFIIWKKGNGSKKMQQALWVFFIQLGLNALWSIIFFGMHLLGLALFEIILMWISILVTIILFYRISKVAAYLLIPYLAWVTFATYLTYSIWMLN